MKAMKEETTEIKQIKDDKDLSKLLFFQVYVATNFFVTIITIIRYVTLPIYQNISLQSRQLNVVSVI